MAFIQYIIDFFYHIWEFFIDYMYVSFVLKWKPHMEKDEILLFIKYLKHATTYVEFGSGGSTYLATQYPKIQNMYSVEASTNWINKLMLEPSIYTKVEKKGLTIEYVDINGDENHWSYPKDESKKNNWRKYYNPWSKISFLQKRELTKPDKHNSRPNIDFILVDGRFRGACVLHSLKYMNENTFLAIHDYTNRPFYHLVENFLEKVKQVNTLCIFRKKDVYQEELRAILLPMFEDDFR